MPIQSFNHFYEDAINDQRSWIKSMRISKYNLTERIKSKHIHFIKNYARFCLNREHVKELLSKEKELKFFYKMHVGDEFFLSVLYPLKNVKDFAVTYDDWEYVHKLKMDIKNKKRELYELQEKTGLDKRKELKELQNYYDNIAKNPKSIKNVEEDLDKINSCDSYFYRKFVKDSNIEKYWKTIINEHEHEH